MRKNANFFKIREIARCRVSYWESGIYEGSQKNFALTQKNTKKSDSRELKNDGFPIGKVTFLMGGRIHEILSKKSGAIPLGKVTSTKVKLITVSFPLGKVTIHK